MAYMGKFISFFFFNFYLYLIFISFFPTEYVHLNMFRLPNKCDLMIDLQLSLAEMILSKSLKWVENWKAPVSKGSLILEGF